MITLKFYKAHEGCQDYIFEVYVPKYTQPFEVQDINFESKTIILSTGGYINVFLNDLVSTEDCSTRIKLEGKINQIIDFGDEETFDLVIDEDIKWYSIIESDDIREVL